MVSTQTGGVASELMLLNYIINNKSLDSVVEYNITEEYFTTYKSMFEYILDYKNKYDTIPSKESVAGCFPNDYYNLEITDPLNAIVDKLKEAKLYRDLMNRFPDVINYIKEERTDKAVELMGSLAAQFQKEPDIKPVKLISNAKDRYDSYVEKTENPTKYYVTTGFPELDAILGGWNRLEESAIICGRPGSGKSWLLSYVALSAAKQGLTVGYYSGEMEADQIGYRLDTFSGNIANGSLTHGNADVKAQYERHVKDLQNQIPGEVICVTPEMMDGTVTVAKLSNFIEKYHLDMLCIDQISLLTDTSGSKGIREQFVNISKELRQMQRLKKIPIIAASQLNREDTKETGITLRNIAESDRIGQDATTVIALERKGQDLVLEVTKAREARTGDKLTYNWNINTGVIKYIPTNINTEANEEEIYGTVDNSDDIF